MHNDLSSFRMEMQHELGNILSYWMDFTVDTTYGGFFGRVDNDNTADTTAPKGSVLNSRILWTFSAAYNLTSDVRYLQVAERAFKYITAHFVDEEFGGVYWTVDYRGKPLDTKKQIYALAFAVYGLSEYYKATKDEQVKHLAIELYSTIVKYSLDTVYGGYIEALTRDWRQIGDLRLSEKDANEKKSMNTHLHILEAFSNLYRIWPGKVLRQRIVDLIDIFFKYVIDPASSHLHLFFDEQWNKRGDIQSYGHDIEAAWLIQEAAEVIQDDELLQLAKERSLKIADAATEGLDSDGGLWYEYDREAQHFIKEKHWWPQAEAIVGYFNAWEITRNETYLQKSMNSWQFIKKYILHKDKGEWYWGVTASYSIMREQDKVGLWKCPYHNSRACIEIITRINKLEGRN